MLLNVHRVQNSLYEDLSIIQQHQLVGAAADVEC